MNEPPPVSDFIPSIMNYLSHSKEQNMNSDHDFPKTPLSRFLDDDNITVMEQLIPYCPSSLGRILAINIKIMELQKIITDFHEGPLLRT